MHFQVGESFNFFSDTYSCYCVVEIFVFNFMFYLSPLTSYIHVKRFEVSED